RVGPELPLSRVVAADVAQHVLARRHPLAELLGKAVEGGGGKAERGKAVPGEKDVERRTGLRIRIPGRGRRDPSPLEQAPEKPPGGRRARDASDLVAGAGKAVGPQDIALDVVQLGADRGHPRSTGFN